MLYSAAAAMIIKFQNIVLVSNTVCIIHTGSYIHYQIVTYPSIHNVSLHLQSSSGGQSTSPFAAACVFEVKNNTPNARMINIVTSLYILYEYQFSGNVFDCFWFL